MEKKLFQKEFIEGADVLSNNGFAKTYRTKNNGIIKLFLDVKDLSEEYTLNIVNLMASLKVSEAAPSILLGAKNLEEYIDKYKELKEKKVLLADDFKQIEEINPPHTAYYDKSGKFIGFEQADVDGINLAKASVLLSKEQRCNLLIDLSKTVEKMNHEGILIPDINNFENLLVKFDDGGLKLIDYDDFQIKDLVTDGVSNSLLKIATCPAFVNKYYDKKSGLYNNNIDKAGLLNVTYSLLCNKNMVEGWYKYQDAVIQLSIMENGRVSTGSFMEEAISLSGFEGTQLEEATKLILNPGKDNIYPTEGLKEYQKKLR